MLTSTQRAKLRGMAQNLAPIFHIGKNGIGENQLNDINDALQAHELIKIAVLKNADLSAKDALQEICDALSAEPVAAIGNKFVVYKYSDRDDIEHIKI